MGLPLLTRSVFFREYSICRRPVLRIILPGMRCRKSMWGCPESRSREDERKPAWNRRETANGIVGCFGVTLYITYSMLLSLPAMYHTFLFSPPDRHRPMLQGKIQQLVNLNALRSAIVLQIAPAFFPALLPGRIFFQPFGLFLPANRQQKSQ